MTRRADYKGKKVKLILIILSILTSTAFGQGNLEKVIAIQSAMIERLKQQLAQQDRDIKMLQAKDTQIISKVNERFAELKIRKSDSALDEANLVRADIDGGFTFSWIKCSNSGGVLSDARLWVNPDGWPSNPPQFERARCSTFSIENGQEIAP